MNDLAYAIKQCRIVNYAVDTNIHCSNKDVCAVQNNLNIDLENATSWFIQNGLKLNPDKYQAMVLGKTEDKFNFKLHDIDIKTTEKTTNGNIAVRVFRHFFLRQFVKDAWLRVWIIHAEHIRAI